jgi:hypothetical protein
MRPNVGTVSATAAGVHQRRETFVPRDVGIEGKGLRLSVVRAAADDLCAAGRIPITGALFVRALGLARFEQRIVTQTFLY